MLTTYYNMVTEEECARACVCVRERERVCVCAFEWVSEWMSEGVWARVCEWEWEYVRGVGGGVGVGVGGWEVGGISRENYMNGTDYGISLHYFFLLQLKTVHSLKFRSFWNQHQQQWQYRCAIFQTICHHLNVKKDEQSQLKESVLL